MKALQEKLEQREKTELIAIIQQMLRQEPDVQWLLTTPLPTPGAQEVSLDPEVYRQQVLAAMAAGDQLRQRKRHEVERRLTAIKAIADGFVKQQQYAAALTIYEVLITEIITHYHDYPDEYIAFSLILQSSIDGLASCFAGKKDNQLIRLRVLHAGTLSLAQQIIGKDSIFFEPALEIGHNRPLQTHHSIIICH
jgi:hypothetical protein